MPSRSGPLRIALAGNPNCGKTSLFNALTGLHHKVANYPGVTVERKEGSTQIEGLGEVLILDLPGTYGLNTHAIDERIASETLLGRHAEDPAPDLIVAVVDASNLERNLFLTTQLIDLGTPLIVALNMLDVAEQRGISMKKELLARLLGVPVVGLAAHKKLGVSELKTEIVNALAREPRPSPARLAWMPENSAYQAAARSLGAQEFPTSAELIGSLLLSESLRPSSPSIATSLRSAQTQLEQSGVSYLGFEATKRYEWINSIVQKTCAVKDPGRKHVAEALDAIIVHKLWGSLIFLCVMGFVFQAIFLWASLPMEMIDRFFGWLGLEIGALMPNGPLRSLIIDGIIPGVGSVVVFIPQIAVLFLFLGTLEDSGYLSRAAFLMDKVMRRAGLQGRSFVPLLSSFACAVPGIMSTRTVPSFADRMTTILVAPLMSCSARLPVYTLLIAAFIPKVYVGGIFSLQGLVLLGMYLLGILGAAVVALILKWSLFRGEPSLFVMEMPPFRLPALRTVFHEIFERVLLFLKSAGTIILACSVILWFLASYPSGDPQRSFAGRLGRTIEPVIEPLGFNWEIGVSIIASFAAREVFVSSLATVYNVTKDDDSTSESLLAALRKRQAQGSFSLPTAFSLMVFYVFACQCMSTLAVCRRETGSWKWSVLMFSYMTLLAYGAAFITYRAASALM